MSKLKKALTLLEDLVNHADEDCPVENRTHWFQETINETREFLEDINKED